MYRQHLQHLAPPHECLGGPERGWLGRAQRRQSAAPQASSSHVHAVPAGDGRQRHARRSREGRQQHGLGRQEAPHSCDLPGLLFVHFWNNLKFIKHKDY